MTLISTLFGPGLSKLHLFSFVVYGMRPTSIFQKYLISHDAPRLFLVPRLIDTERLIISAIMCSTKLMLGSLANWTSPVVQIRRHVMFRKRW